MAEQLPVITPAELKCMREYLGLSTSWMSEHLSCDERRLQRMEVGKQELPLAFMDAIDALYVETQDSVERLVTKYAAQLERRDGPVVMKVYRTDDEYGEAVKHARFPVRWHRQVAARVAERLPSLVLDYATPIDRDIPPWKRAEGAVVS